jgi:hypothetical protein
MLMERSRLDDYDSMKNRLSVNRTQIFKITMIRRTLE